MKKSILFLLSVYLVQFGFTQPNFETLDMQIKGAATDEEKGRIFHALTKNLIFSNPDSAAIVCLQYKSHFEQTKNQEGVAWMLNDLSRAFQNMGDNQKAAALGLSALKQFENIKDTFGILNALNNTSIAFGYNGDWQTAISYQKKILEYTRSYKNERMEALAKANTGDAYLRLNQPDSALSYLSASLEYTSKKNDAYDLGGDYRNFGIYYKQKSMYDLALNYYKNARAKYLEITDLFDLADISNFTAEVYFLMHQYDSSIVYANKAVLLSRQNNFSQYLMDGYTWLYKNYELQNKNDSSFKYLKLSLATKDSLFNEDRNRKTQNLVFSEQMRQQEKAVENQKAEEERKHNLQYSLIALGIVIFLILFFLLSRSIIVTEKWISFFGILGLLIVFEFINLLIHPFLERATRHNLILMLLALVVIASLLIPLHHRIEKWVMKKMTEKNKQIRLANAKRTIEKLENNSAQTKQDDTNV